MDRRFSLGAALLLLFAGALYLWLNPEGQTAAPMAPTVSVEADMPAPERADSSAPAGPAAPALPTDRTHPAFYVLAVSWYPGFCELKPNVPECRSGVTARFSLHGLWPGGEYCGVSQDDVATDQVNHWNDLPAVSLGDATWTALRTAMPGTRSHLERHEWVEHGSCSGTSQDVYFAHAAAFLEAINASPVRELFAASTGRKLTRAKVAAAFDHAFGTGAGKRVRLSCDDTGSDSIIDELTIALYGDPFAGGPLPDLIAAAHPRTGGCDGALVATP